MRDPRIDPRPGDVLIRGKQRREVTERPAPWTDYKGRLRQDVVFIWTRITVDAAPGWRQAHYRSLDKWAEEMAGAEVVHVAGPMGES